MKVIEDHGEQFSESNVTNSFIALAKVADGKGLDEALVHDNRSFQMLVGECCQPHGFASDVQWVGPHATS